MLRLRIWPSSLLLSLVGVALGSVPACSKKNVAARPGGGAGGQGVVDGGKAGSGGGGAVVDAGAGEGGGAQSYPAALGDRWVAIVSPTGVDTFMAPSALRLIAAARDPMGSGGNAQTVEFFVDDDSVMRVDGASADSWIFRGSVAGVEAGVHRVWARATFADPALILDSEPKFVTVAAPQPWARTVSLDADVVITGKQGYELVGTADAHIRLEGNGHRIVSDGEPQAPLTLKYVDVVGLGSWADTTEPAIQVVTAGTITIEDSTFDTSNAVDIDTRDAATASVRRNVFRSNMRVPLGQSPDPIGTSPSYPTVRFTGPSTGAKVFAGNQVGAGWVQLDKTARWLVGGDADADANVIVGPRAGIHVRESGDVQVRNNYSHNASFGGWAQGANFDLGGSPTAIVEHNVISGGSWPVRGAGGEFRYNLVADAGHQFIWPETGGSIHHNVFVGGSADVAGIYLAPQVEDAKVFNNTVDGQLSMSMVTAVSVGDGTTLSLSSNAFVNVARPPGAAKGATVTIAGGTLSADYNAFANEQPMSYSDGRTPVHDVVMKGVDAAKLTDLPTGAYGWFDQALWTRELSVRDLLAEYRRRYAPRAGSPLIDMGDPAGGDGNDIGAVGAGAPNDADRFGRF